MLLFVDFSDTSQLAAVNIAEHYLTHTLHIRLAVGGEADACK